MGVLSSGLLKLKSGALLNLPALRGTAAPARKCEHEADACTSGGASCGRLRAATNGWLRVCQNLQVSSRVNEQADQAQHPFIDL